MTEKRRSVAGGDPGGSPVSPRAPLWSFVRTLVPEVALLLFGAVFWVQTYPFAPDKLAIRGPAFYPRLLMVLLAICVVVLITQNFRAWRHGPIGDLPVPGSDPDSLEVPLLPDGGVEELEEHYPMDSRHLLAGIAISVGYVFATIYLGYALATTLVIVIFVWFTRKLTWAAVLMAIGTGLLFPYIFVKIVFISLPTGVGIFDEFTVWLYRLLGIY